MSDDESAEEYVEEDEEEEEEQMEGEEEENASDSEGSDEDRMAVNPTSVRERIDAALSTLADLKGRVDKSKSRADIIAELSRDLSEYYGYIQELSDYLLELFSPAECVEFMDASDRNRPLVIRTNTLKTTRKDLMEALGKRGANVEGVEWSKVAIKVTESTVPIGATPEYLAGHYMLQAAASLNPVMALSPLPGERVLDMSAAPGGKTTYIAQLMKNSGQIIANDLKPARQKATVANLHRMGVKNTIVCCYDGRKIPSIIKGFDRVLLDAPCSGLGVISRDQTVKIQRTVKDIQRIAHMQKELLLAAIDAVDHKSSSGGICVYSTCSISAEENETVVNYALKKRFVRLIDTGLEVGKPGFTRHKERRFHPSLTLTRRFYPHVHNMDGFYVAKFQKYASGSRGEDDSEDDEDGGGNRKNVKDSESDDEDEEHDEDGDDEEDEEEEEQLAKPPAKKSKAATTVVPPPAKSKSNPHLQSTTKTETKGKVLKTAVVPHAQISHNVPSAKGNSKVQKRDSNKADSDDDDDDDDDDYDDNDHDDDDDSPSRRDSDSEINKTRKRKKRLSLTAIREMNMAAKTKMSPSSRL